MIDLNEKLITIKELMDMAKVSRHTVYRDIKSKKIPVIYFGRNVRIKESDAKSYAEAKGNSKWVALYRDKEAG